MTNFFPPAPYNRQQGGIFIVIYVDVLFVINFFITFFLLRATAKITKKDAKIPRLLAASFVGGAYSLIILIDMPFLLSSALKLAVSAVLLLIAFRFKRAGNFFAAYALFYFMNFVFLGIIYGISLVAKTPYIHMSNGTVYLNIGARGLLFSALFAYIASCFVVRIYNRRLAAGEVFTLTVQNDGKSVELFALCDTGNKLREPFSDSPVIVADGTKLEELINPEKARIIPTKTTTGRDFLLSFKPERVTVRTSRGSEDIENVYIALSDNMKNGEISAVLNPEILTV